MWSFGRAVTQFDGAPFTWNVGQEILNMCMKPTEVVAHEKAAGANGVIASAAAAYGQGAVGPGITDINSAKATVTAEPVQLPQTYGRYTRKSYDKDTKDCSLTYECKYGLGFDEVKVSNFNRSVIAAKHYLL